MIAATDVRAATIVYRTIVIGGIVVAYTYGLSAMVWGTTMTGILLAWRIDRTVAIRDAQVVG